MAVGREPTEFRRRFGGPGAQLPPGSVSKLGVGGKLSIEETARLTVNTAEVALGVQEDLRSEIRAVRALLALSMIHAHTGEALTDDELAWVTEQAPRFPDRPSGSPAVTPPAPPAAPPAAPAAPAGSGSAAPES